MITSAFISILSTAIRMMDIHYHGWMDIEFNGSFTSAGATIRQTRQLPRAQGKEGRKNEKRGGGVKNLSKMSNRAVKLIKTDQSSANLINEEIIKGEKGIIFIRKKFVGNYKDQLLNVIFLYGRGR